jgi:hypothetical protein
VKGAVSGHN